MTDWWYAPPVITTNNTQLVYSWWVQQTGSAQVWQHWTTSSTTVSTMPIWRGWAGVLPNPYPGLFDFHTPDQAEFARAADTQRAAARTRSRSLLESMLDEDQRAELAAAGRFHVTGSRGRRYCIRTAGQAGNVDLLGGPHQQRVASLCIHPRGVPDADAWLTQMLAIRTDEDAFLATANVTAGRLPQEVQAALRERAAA